MVENPHEMYMWESEVVVTSDQLKSYAANYAPMGVYIPRGRVKVPHRRSGTTTSQIPRTAKGKANSPNLLMIKPTFIQPLPTKDVHVTRQRDVKADFSTMCQQPASRTLDHGAHQQLRIKVEKLSASPMRNPMSSQSIYSGNGVGNDILHYNKLTDNEPLPHLTVQSVLPPPYPIPGKESYNEFSNHPKSSDRDITSLMTQEMGHPLGQRYYQHLSAIAAMAWSDCNQATEKFRRIYEETAHLSGNHDPFGLFYERRPMYSHPSLYIDASSSVPNSKDSCIWSDRYHQLARDQQKYCNDQAVLQSKMQNKYANLSMFCDVHKKPGVMTSASPLPGVALFNSQSLPHHNVPCDVTNQRNYSRQTCGFPPKPHAIRQKRKLTEQRDLYPGFGSSFDQRYYAKLPRMSSSSQGLYFDSASTSQPLCDIHPFLPAAMRHDTQTPADSLFQSGIQHPIPDLLKKVGKQKLSSVMHDSIGDVTKTSSLTERLCLPSVSYSPSDSCLKFPFVMQ